MAETVRRVVHADPEFLSWEELAVYDRTHAAVIVDARPVERRATPPRRDADLDAYVAAVVAEAARASAARADRRPPGRLPRALSREACAAALAAATSYSAAARLLGVPRVTLRDSCAAYGLVAPDGRTRAARLGDHPAGGPPWNGRPAPREDDDA